MANLWPPNIYRTIKGLCILKPGSVSSVLLNRIRSLAMQYEDSEGEESFSVHAIFYHFLQMASRNVGRSCFV